MSDIICNDAAQWRQLCQNAFFELDPVLLLQYVVEARQAVLERIEVTASNPEKIALCDALKTLNILQELAHRDLAELKKCVQSEYRDFSRPNVVHLRR
jgi:hypothetical protein